MHARILRLSLGAALAAAAPCGWGAEAGRPGTAGPRSVPAAATEVRPSWLAGVQLIQESSERVPDGALGRLADALAALQQQFPGVLRRVVIRDGGPAVDPGHVLWGSISREEGAIFLNRHLFYQDEDKLVGVAAHEFGHLIYPQVEDRRWHKEWLDLFNSAEGLEFDPAQKSRIMYWFGDAQYYARPPSGDVGRIGREFAPNQSELYAMVFAIKFLWLPRFTRIVASGARTPVERERVRDILARVPVQPWDGSARPSR